MYVELHARSAFSFLEGSSNPEDLIGRAAELGLPAVALLDRDGVYGAPRFHQAAKKRGLRALIGAEVTTGDGSRWPLLVKTRAGYQNLCRLITLMKMRAPKGTGALTLDEIAAHADGLVGLTGAEDGPLAGALRDGGIEAATRQAERMIATLGRENVYAELQRHHERDEAARNQAVVDLARGLHLPLVATGGVAYATRDRRLVHDVFTCLRHHVKLASAGRRLARNSERHLKSAAEMARLFSDLPEAVAQTAELAGRLEFTLTDLGYQFPHYPVPGRDTMMSFLRKRTEEGARDRFRPYHERARAQIARELALIEKLEFAGYFLIVWDIVRFCRENGILVQGRGSAANSAVCYALGITAVDPVGMDLLFERFLSEERGEWPDIDLDLPSGVQRERAIQYVYQRYGRLGAAMTANVITYRGRSAAREVGKVLGFDEETTARLASLAGGFEWKDPKDTDAHLFRQAGLDIPGNHEAIPQDERPSIHSSAADDRRIRRFLQLYRDVQDLPRHLGQHSGGMVIAAGQLDTVVPLEPASMPGRVVVQWDKDDCADLGIVKVDLLGLGMMAVFEDSLTLIRDAYGEEVSLAHLPADDPDVYAALQKADTVGMFQIESRAQMSCLPRLRPERFYDIVVQVAIIRPGPIVGNMVHPYLRRRREREAPECLHPSLEPVLARTLGVPLFQEQLLRIAMIAAGFTGGEAEELRRAMGFKRSEKRMAEIEVKLRRGMDSKGITGTTQDRIVQAISSFALYGFPESHAASFALLAYASAYLKCHYLAAFTTAMLNNQPMGFYAPATLVKDAQRHGLTVRPIDVTQSDWLCTIEAPSWRALPTSEAPAPSLRGRPSSEAPEAIRHHHQMASSPGTDGAPRHDVPARAIRLGLRYVKGLREAAGRAIVAARTRAPFADIEDLARRVPGLRKDELAQLAEVGALNFIQPETHRRTALWQIERAWRKPGPLFEGVATPDDDSPLVPMTPEERLSADFRGTGVTIGKHPMAYRRGEMNAQKVTPVAALLSMDDGHAVRIAGSVIVRQRPGTAKGFLFLSLEDETGIANVIVAPPLFDRSRDVLVGEPFLIIDGVLQNQDGAISVKAHRIRPLAVGAAAPSHDFH
jgi:error-prone DNA polymerase